MKKYLIIFFSILSYLSCYSQQFEWFKTFNFSYPLNNYQHLDSRICNLGENIALVSISFGKNVILEETKQSILNGYKIEPDPYIIVLNKQGNILKSKMIYTTNGIDNFKNIFYNKNNGLIYFVLNTSSDSISFDSAKTWGRLIRKNSNTENAIIAIFDKDLNYIHSLCFSSYSGVGIGDISIDNSGNIYCYGYYNDSLKLNNKILLKTRTKYQEHFVLKINNSNEVEWVNNFGILRIQTMGFNESRNVLYVPFETYKENSQILYNNNIDSVNFKENYNPTTILAELDILTGYIKKYIKIIYTGIEGMRHVQIKSNKNTILLNCGLGGNGNKKFVFDNDTSEFNVSNGRMFIIGFDALTLKKKFINFFGNTELSSYNFHLITEIYNDSLYSIKGLTNGNFNFSFNGQNNYSEDYLKTRPSGFASDYFATYTTSNQLKDVWYLTEHPYVEYPTFYGNNSPYIFEKDGDIYISGNIKYYASLGLGKREFNYSTYIDKSLTLVKYNCKPTAYFKYKNENDSVLFKNVSTGFCSYKWDFGDGTSTTQKSPYHKFASKTQSYKVSLITTNSCGSDTFYRYYSFSAGLTSFKYNSQIKIYPNPIRGNTIKIEMPENTEIKSVKIYSPTGQQLDECSFDKTEKTNYTATIGSKLSKGIYYVKIILDDNTGYVTKVIIGE